MMTMPANGNDPNPDASFPFLIHVNPSLISCATRRTAAAVSYKEASEDEATDSEDLLEFEYDESQAATTAAAAEEEEKCETIERILAQRAGKKDAPGAQTTDCCREIKESSSSQEQKENVRSSAFSFLIFFAKPIV